LECFSNFFANVVEFAPKIEQKISQFSYKKHNNFVPQRLHTTLVYTLWTIYVGIVDLFRTPSRMHKQTTTKFTRNNQNYVTWNLLVISGVDHVDQD